MGDLDQALDPVDGPQGVRDMGQRHELRPPRQQRLVSVLAQLAVVGDRDHPQGRPLFLAEPLPGDDVGVVLHPRDHDLVTGADVKASIRLGDKIDRLGGAPHENDLPVLPGVQKRLNPGPGLLEEPGRPIAEGMHAAMDVGVGRLVIPGHGLENRTRLLGRRGIVQVNQGRLVDDLIQRGEHPPDSCDVQVVPGVRPGTRAPIRRGQGNIHRRSLSVLRPLRDGRVPVPGFAARRQVGRGPSTRVKGPCRTAHSILDGTAEVAPFRLGGRRGPRDGPGAYPVASVASTARALGKRMLFSL